MGQGAGGGPRTDGGKKRVSQNPYKHGILSKVAALHPMEAESEWEYFRDGTMESLGPEGFLECNIAENIAWALWCKRRLIYHQQMLAARRIRQAREDLMIAQAYADQTLAQGVYPEVSDAEVNRAKSVRIIPEADDMALILRYDAHLHRQQIQLMRELETMQARRRGEATPMVRMDMSGGPLVNPSSFSPVIPSPSREGPRDLGGGGGRARSVGRVSTRQQSASQPSPLSPVIPSPSREGPRDLGGGGRTRSGWVGFGTRQQSAYPFSKSADRSIRSDPSTRHSSAAVRHSTWRNYTWLLRGKLGRWRTGCAS